MFSVVVVVVRALLLFSTTTPGLTAFTQPSIMSVFFNSGGIPSPPFSQGKVHSSMVLYLLKNRLYVVFYSEHFAWL